MTDIGKDPACCATCKRALDETEKYTGPGSAEDYAAWQGAAWDASQRSRGVIYDSSDPEARRLASEELTRQAQEMWTNASDAGRYWYAEVVKLRAEVARLEADIDASSASRDTQEAEQNRSLRAECAKLRAEVARLEAECAAAWTQPDAETAAEVARLTAERDGAVRELDAWRAETRTVQAEVVRVIAERDEARAERDRAVESWRIAEHLSSGSAEVARLRAELRDALEGRQRDRDEHAAPWLATEGVTFKLDAGWYTVDRTVKIARIPTPEEGMARVVAARAECDRLTADLARIGAERDATDAVTADLVWAWRDLAARYCAVEPCPSCWRPKLTGETACVDCARDAERLGDAP